MSVSYYSVAMLGVVIEKRDVTFKKKQYDPDTGAAYYKEFQRDAYFLEGTSSEIDFGECHDELFLYDDVGSFGIQDVMKNKKLLGISLASIGYYSDENPVPIDVSSLGELILRVKEELAKLGIQREPQLFVGLHCDC